MKLNYVLNPLSARGSLISDGRFLRPEWANILGNFSCLYLAPNEHVMAAECLIDPFTSKSPRASIWVKANLTNILDTKSLPSMTKYAVFSLLSKENWQWLNIRTGKPSVSQNFGLHAFLKGYGGILYQSHRIDAPEAKNLCIFPSNLQTAKDMLLVHDPEGAYEALEVPPSRLMLPANLALIGISID